RPTVGWVESSRPTQSRKLLIGKGGSSKTRPTLRIYESTNPMDVFITLRIALRALAKNKMRAGLTVLGLVIGIAAVTLMVSIGQSASALVQGQFQNLGTNVILIFPGSQRNGGVRQGLIPSLTAA